MSNHDEVKALIERISGQASIITVLRIYVDICGDFETAAVLSQCVFWSDKGSLAEGWFYKSREEWNREIGIKRSSLGGAIDRLKSIGVIETKVMPAKHNSPTTFYRVNMNMLTQVILNHLQSRLAEINQSTARSVETSQSTAGRSVEINQSDWLKSTSPSADFNQSSYSSLHRINNRNVLGSEESQSLQSEVSESDLETWHQIISELGFDAKPQTFKAYIAPARPISVNGAWTIAVPSVEWWGQQATGIKRIYRKLTGETTEFIFVQDEVK